MSSVRWSIIVGSDTDRALRLYLTRKGGKKVDISRFVDEAVQARLVELTVRSIKKRNRKYSQKKILSAIDGALKAA
ncbi:MAG: hypothetical protein A2W18_01245 [Candidatus Muproteobacteria bacterium RBG_16_60_9]|uniref:XACb0070 ribbon-helix-helix domain-containing protein n=1 Tax=Candidatus Muproteobacteria bacterium RBG_16_60_9 TaxID=1817755 RepID=A0A1F6V3A4_9PROT|nr:MAG: hypothetical protein A2W18_01245 [Candidatus Muproteobacteria bacterium RBG_16_60_9]